MPEAEQAVRLAEAGDVKQLGDVLADAFADDPVVSWLIPPWVDDRDERLRLFFTSMSRTYLRLGKPCYLAGDGSAAALWGSPDSWKLPMEEMVSEAEPQIAAFGDRLETAVELQLQIEGLHPANPPHFYLAYLGARRGSQGRGHGGRLMQSVLTQADADGVPAYLESSNARNVPLYERHGFTVVGEFRALNDGPTMWRMWREPAAS